MLNLPYRSKGFAHPLLLLLLLIGLGVGLYLLNQKTNFLPKASLEKSGGGMVQGVPGDLQISCPTNDSEKNDYVDFGWQTVPGVTNYVLKINRVDGGPDDWFPSGDEKSTGDRTLARSSQIGDTLISFREPIEKDKNYSWTVSAGSNGDDINTTASGGEFSCGHPTAYIFGSDFQKREFTTAVNNPLAFNIAAQSKTDSGDFLRSVYLTKIEVYVAKMSDVDNKTSQPFQGGKCLKTAGSWCLVNVQDGAVQEDDGLFGQRNLGKSYKFDGSWVPQQTGDYYMVVNVTDSKNKKCSGNPNTPAGWSKCGTKDSILVHVKDSLSEIPTNVTGGLAANCIDRSTVSLNWPKSDSAVGYTININRLDGTKSTDWSKDINWTPTQGKEGTGDRIIKLQGDTNKIEALRVNGEKVYSWNVSYVGPGSASRTEYGNEFSCSHPTAALFGSGDETKIMNTAIAPLTFKATAQTQFGKLTKVIAYAARKDGSGQIVPFLGSCPGAVANNIWCNLGSVVNPGSGKAEFTTSSWTPEAGQYYVVVNAESDDNRRKCSGNPDDKASVGFDSCGTNGRMELTVSNLVR